MNSSLIQLGPKLAQYEVVQKAKQALLIYNTLPNTVKQYIEPVLGKAIPREKLRALAENPDLLDKETNDFVQNLSSTLWQSLTSFSLGDMAQKLPGVGGALKAGQKGLDAAKGMLGLKPPEQVSETDPSLETKETEKPEAPDDAKKGLLAFAKRQFKKRPILTTVGGVAVAYIGIKIVLPLMWSAAKWVVGGVLGIFGLKKFAGMFGGGQPPPESDPIRDLHQPEEDLTVDDEAPAGAEHNENVLQKGANVANKLLEKSVPGWRELGGHKITNMIKDKVIPGQAKPLNPGEAGEEEAAGMGGLGGLLGGGGGAGGGLGALLGGGAKPGAGIGSALKALSSLAGKGKK